MQDFIVLLSDFLSIFPHPILLPFFGAMIGGEAAIILIAMMVAVGTISMPTLLIGAYLGTLLSDAGWFWFGKRFHLFLERKPSIQRHFSLLAAFVHRLSGESYFLALLVTKFLHGTRILMLFFLATHGLPFLRFLGYNLFVTGVWVFTVSYLGWLAGLGIINVVGVYGDVTLLLGIVAIASIVIYAIRTWLNRVII